MPNTRRVAAPTIVLLFGTCVFAGNGLQTPLYFEQNKGQTDARARFVARGGNLTAFITADGFTTLLNGEAVSMHIQGANQKAEFVSENAIEGVSNYYLGSRVVTGVPHYGRVRVSQIRDGIDLVYHGSERELEYDFVIHPGADPDAIRLRFDGAARAALAGNGDLVLKVANGELRQKKPKVWQEDATGRHEIECRYVLGRRGDVRLALGNYRPSEELVIDPVLSYSTFLGGTGNDWAAGIAVDASGYAYVTGYTYSTDFPVTSGTLHGFSQDAFVTKLNPSATALIYSTYIGGTYGDQSSAIAINAGSAYITGNTSSSDFPVTVGNTKQGAFVVKLDSNGALVYSNVLAAATGNAIAVDSAGAAYVAGYAATGFPSTAGSAQPTLGGGTDAFVAKLGTTGQVVYATFLGGSGSDAANAIAVDPSGDAFVAGYTQSANFPFTAGAYSTNLKGQQSAFVAKLNPSGSAVLFGTYLGGSQSDVANGLALDAAGNSYVVGNTNSNNFPTTPNAFSTTRPTSYNTSAFASKINATGTSLMYSTFIGGSGSDQASNVAVDNNGLAYIVGTTSSNDFPTTVGALKRNMSSQYGSSDIFLEQVSADGSALQYSTLLGSIGTENGNAVALDGNGGVYIAGATQSANYPTTLGAIRTTNPKSGVNYGYGNTGVVSKIDLNSPTMCIPSVSPQSASIPGRGGPFSFNLTLASGCPWEAVILNTYSYLTVTLTGATHGMGSSSPIAITGTVPVNDNTGSSATGTVQLGAATFTINQDPGSCQDPVISPLSYTFDVSGGIRNISVSLPSPCSWTAASSAPWLSVSSPNPPSGNGAATITINAPRNSFSQRSATITIAGKAITITQNGSTCTATASGAPPVFTGQGGTGVAHIFTSSTNCAWAAYSYVPWIQLGTSSASGQGSGTVPFIVAGNPSTIARSGQILIGDQMLTINQAAGPAGTVNSYTTSLFAGGGSGSVSNLGDGGPATSAVLNFPASLAFDAVSGNLYIAETNNARVRVVTPDLNINTFAGGGTSTAENVPALTAALRSVNAVGVDNSGSVYVNDFFTRIRQIKLGNIATFAGTTSPGFSGDNGPATSALMSSPGGVVSDTSGNVYIADTANNRVREVSAGTITTIAGGGTSGLGDGGPATSATLSRPMGLAFDGAGGLYIADYNNNRVRKVANGVITTVAGGGSGADGGPATSAFLYNPVAVALDPAGNIFIAENNRIRRVAADGTISTVTPGYYNPQGIAGDRAGNLYFSDYYAGKVWKLTPLPSFCSYVVSTPSTHTSAGGPLSITVSAAAGCNWTASSDLPWATISSGSSGTGNGTVSLTIASNAGPLRTGSIVIAGQTVLLTEGGISRIGDFDANGVPDLVWMNNATHQVTVNYFGGAQGAIQLGSNYLHPAADAAAWHVAAVADFDGNGIPDLVWINDTTRQVVVNYYGGAGGAVQTGFAVLYANATPGWHIVGAGDFDGNGVPDLVWQNDSTGQVTVHYFGGAGGATQIGFNWLYQQNVSGWHAMAIADINGDGVPDVIWQNDNTHQVTVNYFGGPGGATYTGWNWLHQGLDALPWHVVGALDFDVNGTPDLIWYNDNTTQVVVNYYSIISGVPTITGYAYLYPGSTAGWTLIN